MPASLCALARPNGIGSRARAESASSSRRSPSRGCHRRSSRPRPRRSPSARGERHRVLDAPAALDVVDPTRRARTSAASRPRLPHGARASSGKRIGSRASRHTRPCAYSRAATGTCAAGSHAPRVSHRCRTRGDRAPHGVAVGREHRLEVARLERARRDPALAELLLGGRDDRPGLVAAVEISCLSGPLPSHGRALLACVRRARAGSPAPAPWLLTKSTMRLRPGNVRFVPDAVSPCVIRPRRSTASLRRIRCPRRLARTCEVHEVPVADMPVLRRVLAHRETTMRLRAFNFAQCDRWKRNGSLISIRGQGRN